MIIGKTTGKFISKEEFDKIEQSLYSGVLYDNLFDNSYIKPKRLKLTLKLK